MPSRMHMVFKLWWSSGVKDGNNNNNNNNNNNDLTIEIQLTWNVKTKVIPVIIGATETISKLFRKCVSSEQQTRKT